MKRVLDIDLDFFLHGVVHWPPEDQERPSAEDCPPWSIEESLQFLTDRCGLTGPLPGLVVENHGEIFPLWRTAIQRGILQPPFHVTHVDAHADLGLGDTAYLYIMGTLIQQPVEDRAYPPVGGFPGLGDGNYLAYAIANRWISDLEYVFTPGGGDDAMHYYREQFNRDSPYLRIPALSKEHFEAIKWSQDPKLNYAEPRVPFAQHRADSFHTDEPFDLVCLARSPPYSPAEADVIFDTIRKRFIDETVLSDF